MRIDTDGNVGIGGTPARKTHIFDSVNGYSLGLQQTSAYNSGNQSGIVFSAPYNAGGAVTDLASIRGGKENITDGHYGGIVTIWTRANGGSDTERMRINSSGNLLVGTTTTDRTAAAGTHIDPVGFIEASRTSNVAARFTRLADTGSLILFRQATTQVGSISVTGSATAYNTSSDYRLKENVVTDWDATTRLKQLKPSRFNFISDPDKTVDGFLAHEVQAIVPEAITGTKDAVDAEGNPDYQGIDQSKLVPLLVKVIQELEARITTLEGS
jgi:hypothetical protein